MGDAYQLGRLPESLHDDMWADALLDETSDLFQKLSSKKHHTRCAVANFRILSTSDVHKCTRSGMDDV